MPRPPSKSASAVQLKFDFAPSSDRLAKSDVEEALLSSGALQRRLAAILAADVVAYSRQMAEDEPGTLARLRALRSEVIEPLTVTHGGRVFAVMGDGFLVEFASTVQAVACAL